MISVNMLLIYNLANTAKYHKKNCKDEDCNISLYQLRVTAQRLTDNINEGELTEAYNIINEMPIV